MNNNNLVGVLLGAIIGLVIALIIAPFRSRREQNPFIITKIQKYVSR